MGRARAGGVAASGGLVRLAGLVCVALLALPAVAAAFPVTSISGVTAGWVSHDVTVTLTATPPDGALTWYSLEGRSPQVYGGPFAVSREGVTTLTYWSRDGHTAMEDPGSATVLIDKTAPSCALTGLPEGWVAPGPHTAVLSAGDALSGVSSLFYRIGAGGLQETSGAISLDAATSTWIEYWAWDVAGNVSVPRVAPLRIADGSPLTYPVGRPVGWSRGDVEIGLVAESSDAPVVSTLVSLAYAPACAYDGTITVSAEGVTPVSFRSIDALGHTEVTRSVDVAIDRTPPVSWATGVPSGVSSSAVAVRLFASDAVSGVAAIMCAVDGSLPQPSTGSVGLLADSGAVHVEWWAVDLAGNEGARRTADVRFDRVAPVTGCDAQPSYAASASIRLTAIDPPGGSGVAATWYRLDGGPATLGTTVGTAGPGAHGLEFWSVDGAGNAEAAKWVTFSVNAVPGGDPSTPPTSSAPPTATAPPAQPLVVGTPYAPPTVRRGRAFTVSGTVRPRLAAGTTVRVELHRLVSGHWRLQYSLRPALAGYAGFSRYSLRAGLSRTGRWRLRAWVLRSGRRTYSAYRALRVL